MLGCHIAKEVEVRLQNGLKFKFRESQELKESHTFWHKINSDCVYPPKFSRGHRGHIGDEIAVRTTVMASSKRLLHFVNEVP